MTIITPEDILDAEVKNVFASDPAQVPPVYNRNLEYFDRADGWFDVVALKLGLIPSDYPVEPTVPTINLLALYVMTCVCQNRIGINITYAANGQKVDMWKDKYNEYKESLSDALDEFDRTDLLGYPEDTLAPNEAPDTFNLFRT